MARPKWLGGKGGDSDAPSGPAEVQEALVASVNARTQAAHALGYSQGLEAGDDAGYERGHAEGLEEGRTQEGQGALEWLLATAQQLEAGTLPGLDDMTSYGPPET